MISTSNRNFLPNVARRDFLQLLAAASVVPRQALAQSGNDVAIMDGRVITMDSARPEAEAVLVRNGRIAVVGSNEEVEREAGGIPRFDADRRVVVPGFIDTHVHFEMTCLAREYQAPCHTPPHRSLQDIFATLEDWAGRTPKGQWIVGRSSFGLAGKVEERRLANRHELDAITSDQPLALCSGLHVGMLNTAALPPRRRSPPSAFPWSSTHA
jgi:predicted amidohydrolase YtcJ